MSTDQLLSELEALGTDQNRKIYRRHGVGENMFGVSYANLGRLQKKIKIDHQVAQELWSTGNYDARVLATMIADPQQASDKLLQAWARDLDSYVITDAFSKFASATPLARKKMEKWITSKQEWLGAAGWNLLAVMAMKDQELADDFFERYLSVIEITLHKSKNRVRYAMNGALIAIGLRNERLQKKAMTVAKRVGKVEVDHGETGCKTPDAIEYIQRVARRGGKSKEAASGAK